MEKIIIDKSELEQLFKIEHKTIKEIATIFNCAQSTIRNKLKKYGLYTSKNAIDTSIIPEGLDQKEVIRYLYIEKRYNCSQIGQALGLSEKTINYYLKQMSVPLRSNKKIIYEKFIELWNQGKSDLEIAEYFGVKETTVKSYRTRGENAGKFTRNDFFSEKDIQLTELQEQFILGSLLGDLSIDWTKDMKNAKLCLVHSIKQEELFLKKVELLDNFMGNYKLYTPAPDKRTGKIYQTWRGNSKTHKIFNDIYNLLYINNVKTITQDYLNRINHPIALAFLFMDDGTYRGTIATHCFTEHEIDLLIDWFYNKWDIICTKQKNLKHYTLYISEKSRYKFEKLIFPYIVPSMYYKLKYVNIINAESV